MVARQGLPAVGREDGACSMTQITPRETTALPPMMKASEAASIAGVSARTICRLCESGQIRAAKLGSSWRINRAAFLQQLGIGEADPIV